MARSFVSASSQEAKFNGSAPVTNYPWTVAVWFKVNSVTGSNQTIAMLGFSGNFNDEIGGMEIKATTGLFGGFVSDTGGTFQGATVSGAPSTGAWHAGAYVGVGSTNRTLYLDGGNATSDTASCVYTGGVTNQVVVGAFDSGGSTSSFFGGAVAELAVWNVALTAGEVAAHARGVRPYLIRPSALVGYWPLWGLASPEPDMSGSKRNLTLTNTPAFATHAPITLWTPKSSGPVNATTGGVVNTWGWQAPEPQGTPAQRRIPRNSAMLGEDGARDVFRLWRNAGWESQAHQPRHPRPERAGAIADWDDGNEKPFVPPTLVVWWELQPSFSPAYRVRKQPAMSRGDDDGVDGAFLRWVNGGWEVQPWQPPHPRPERAAPLIRGDDGTQAAFSQWFNAGWEFQAPVFRWLPSSRRAALDGDVGFASFTTIPWWECWDFYVPQPRGKRGAAVAPWIDPSWPQTVAPAANVWGWDPTLLSMPRQPRGKAAGWFPGDPGTQAAFIAFVNYGWPVQPWQPPRLRWERAAAGIRGDDGSAAPFVFWRNGGWEVAPHQPGHPRPERASAIMLGEPGNEAPFIFNVIPLNFWEVALPPAYRPRWERAAGTMRGDDGTQATFNLWRNAGWEIAPHQPQHPRPERGGWLFGEAGIEAPFVAPVFPWAWEVAPPAPYRMPWRWAGGTMRGLDGTDSPFARWFNAGWETQPPQPPHPRPERASAWMPLEPGTQAPFIRWVNDGWEVQPWQPPHPRREKAGGWMPIEPGNEAPFIFVPFVLTSVGWDVLFYPPRRFLRIPAFLQGDPGNEAAFQRWFNAGWEVQPWQPPHPKPEQKFAAAALGDDGNASPFIQFFPQGWPVQPWQPPHPRPERASAWMRGDDGNYNVFRFQPVSYAPYPWDVLLQPPYLRWGRGVMWMPVGIDVVPTIIPRPTVSACVVYGRAVRPILSGDACGCC